MPTPKIGTQRKFVIENDVLDDLHLIAAHRGETVSEVVRAALRDYTKRTLGRGGRAA